MNAGSTAAVAAASLALAAGALAAVSRERPAGDAAAPETWLVGRDQPLAFTGGSCVGFQPLREWNGRTVFVDPGHGGIDTGALAAAGSEADLTLAVARRFVETLRRRGFRVVVSRLADSTVAQLRARDRSGRLLTAGGVHRDIVARTVCANAAQADVLLAVHLNSFVDPAVGGAQTIYNANRSFSRRSRLLAAAVQRAVASALPVRDRGVVTDTSVGATALTKRAAAYGQLLELGPAAPPWFSRPSRMPGALVEPVFLTNPREAALVARASGRAALARALADGVEAYFRSAGA